MRKRIDMIGKRFGRWIVIKSAGNVKKHLAYKCQCDCGKYGIVNGSNLRTGQTKSCGCLRDEQISLIAWKHGLSNTRLYNVWRSFRRRCNNKNTSDYHRYGGRGITICKEWDSFINFYNWAKVNGYKDNLFIDRKDNNKGYFPWNCRFITRKKNNQNTRNSRRWNIDGKIFNSSASAAKFFNVSPITIRRWCLGRKDQNKPQTKPHRPNCSAPKLY